MRTILNEKILAMVQTSPSIRTGIAAAMRVHPNTVSRWAKDNDPQLAHPDSIAAIKLWATLPKGESYTCQVEQGDKHLTIT